MRSWFHSWRAAIRIARRDAMRSKGRSVLVLLMIALPIVGVSAADITVRSAELTTEQQLDRELGAADARYSDADIGGIPIMQSPSGDDGYATDEKYNDDSRYINPKKPDVKSHLPAGATWITDTTTTGLARTEHGLLDTGIREIRAEHPLAAGIVTLLRGRLPAKGSEIAASTAFLEKSGLHLGSSTTVRGLDQRYTIVGAVEFPDELHAVRLVARPGAVAAALDKARAVHGAQDWSTTTSYLVSVPGKVSWDMVRQANAKGLLVRSRAVALDPPPDDQVPMYRQEGYGRPGGGGDSAELLIVAATVAGMAILEICLLAGPAFAVGARRSRRQLGLVGANGGDRRHIRAIVLSGGIVIGTAAAVLGLALALGLTLALQPLLENAVGKRFAGIEVRPLEMLGLALAGLVTGLLAAVAPAFVASRQSVLEALTGRRGVRRSSRVLPVVGLGAVLLGVALAVFGSMAMDTALPVGAGSAIAELGVVALTPALVGIFGRFGKWLPLSPRLALRDAVRNRGRTAPAVAAVLAAVAGTVAIATYTASSEQQNREDYQANAPDGRVVVSVQAEELPELPRIRAAVEKHLPVDQRADVRRIVPGSKDCGSAGTGDPDCGSAALVVPPEQECPLWVDDEPTPAERRKYRDDWRCETDTAFRSFPMYTESQVLVGGPELLRALGITDSRAGQALERGEAVAFQRHHVKDGRITLNVAAKYDEAATEQKGRKIPVPAYLSSAESYNIFAVMPEKALQAAHVKTAPFGSLYSTTKTPSSASEQELKSALVQLGVTAEPYVERGFQPQYDIVLLSLAIFAGLVTLGAAGIATGLAQADAEADLNTLAAVGAAPRVRRTLSGLQCGLVAAMGVALGTVAGLVPAVGLRKAEEAVALKDFARNQAQGFQAPPVHIPIVVPWETLLEILVVVPLAAALLAALFTRSRTALARRAG